MSGSPDAAAFEDDLAKVRQELAQCQEDGARDKEEFEKKMQDIRQKTKEHITKMQEKMQVVLTKKDSELKEVETAKEEALLEVAALRAKPSEASLEQATTAEARVQALEQELASVRETLRAHEEKAAQPVLLNGDEDEQLRVFRLDLQEATSQRDAAQANAQAQCQVTETVKAQLVEVQEELERTRQETQAKISEVVSRAKEHVKSVQVRLEAQVSENKQLQANFDVKESENRELTDKFREVDDAYAQQQDKLNKYKQLMAQANARIEDGDDSSRDVREALSKLKEEHERLQQQHSSAENACVPPSKEDIAQLGGVLLTVEAENDDVWCLLSGATNSVLSGDQTPTAMRRRRWWLSSQLDLDVEKPIPLQRRWKGEVSALRAQTARAKKRGEEVQVEFEAYRQKANAALQTGATSSEETLHRERKFEQLGQQLQATGLELQQLQGEKAKVFEDLGEVRRRLQEASAQNGELERTLEHRMQEGLEAQKAAVADCRRELEKDRDRLAQKWREQERSYLQELDLRRTQKESLDEEIEGLRSRLSSRLAQPVLAREPSAESGSEDGRGPGVPSSAPSHDSDAVPATPPRDLGLERLGGSPLDDGVWRGVKISPRPSPRPSPRVGSSGSKEANPSLSSSAPAGTSAPTDALGESADGGEDAAQAYSLHASVARQDLASLRAQVRQLEAVLQAEKQQNRVLMREKDSLATEVREVEEQKVLQNVVGQHQQMEYIRSVFRKFVETLPAGKAEHEQLIPVLMTFFQFGPEELRAIQGKRPQALTWLSGWRG